MILPRFDICPLCIRQGHNYEWRPINHNSGWWEYKCMGYYMQKDPGCCFSQYFFKSFEDKELKYFHFYLPDYNVYVYSEHYGYSGYELNGKIYIYHREFPRGESKQGPFLILDHFPIDWDNLHKLNDKLNLYKTFV